MKKRMKKIGVLIGVMALSCTMFAACGGQKDISGSSVASSAAKAESSETEEESVIEESASKAESDAKDKSDAAEDSKTESKSDADTDASSAEEKSEDKKDKDADKKPEKEDTDTASSDAEEESAASSASSDKENADESTSASADEEKDEKAKASDNKKDKDASDKSEAAAESTSSDKDAEASSSASESEAKEEAVNVAGEYAAVFDLNDLVGEEMEESGLKLKGELPVNYTLILDEKDGFDMDMDREAFNKMMTDVLTEQGPDIVKGMFEEEGITRENFDELAEISGYGTYDEFVDSMVEEMINSMKESMASDMELSTHISGTYTVNGSTLTLKSPEKDGEKTFEEKGEIRDDGTIVIGIDMNDSENVALEFVKQ